MGTEQKVARLTPSPEMPFVSILGDKIVGLRNQKSGLGGHFVCSYSHKEK